MDATPIAKNHHCHMDHRRSSRREILAAASAVCAASFTPSRHAIASVGSKLIDTHHNFYLPTYQKAWADWEDQRKIPHCAVQLTCTREQDIEAMVTTRSTTRRLSL